MPEPSSPQGLAVGRSAAIKLISDTSTMVLGIVASVVTARALGPAGRGTFAVLLLLISIFTAAGSLGLNDALVVLRGRLDVASSKLLAGVLPVGLIAGLIASLLLVAVATLQFGMGGDPSVAILLAASSVPPTVLHLITTGALNANHETIRTSRLMLFHSILLTASLVTGLTVLGANLTSAFLAVLFASTVTLAMTIRAAIRSRLWSRPRFDPRLSAAAVRYGFLAMTGSLLIQSTARADLVVVLHLLGNAATGQYSIALTVGGIVGGVAVAISFAAFPVLATARDEKMWELTTMMCRGAILLASLLATLVAITAPVLIPVVFGGAYRPSVAPALLMLIVGVLSTPQWILARARAAEGRPSRLLISYSLSTACMLGSDFILIPRLGLAGGAVAAILGVLVGLSYAVVEFHMAHRKTGQDFHDLLPTRRDAVHVLALLRAFLFESRTLPRSLR